MIKVSLRLLAIVMGWMDYDTKRSRICWLLLWDGMKHAGIHAIHIYFFMFFLVCVCVFFYSCSRDQGGPSSPDVYLPKVKTISQLSCSKQHRRWFGRTNSHDEEVYPTVSEYTYRYF